METLTEWRVKKLRKKFAGKDWDGPDCYNKRPGTGWAIVGHAGYSRAIAMAGLPLANYWSGSNPTPSSQAPKEIVRFCYNKFQ
jgi:hypothetical protein